MFFRVETCSGLIPERICTMCNYTLMHLEKMLGWHAEELILYTVKYIVTFTIHCYCYTEQSIVTVYRVMLQCTEYYYSEQNSVTVYKVLLECTEYYYSVQSIVTVYRVELQSTEYNYSEQSSVTVYRVLLQCTE